MRGALCALVLVPHGGIIDSPRSSHHRCPLHREVNPLLLSPLPAPPVCDPMVEGNKEVCGAELHATRVTT